ncbi:uncharacterized protein PV09_09773 [Verruconis gallopava]|uniref:Uncharacterized protein n=1 Tax=Verruconis gallopava TaxID=253628 RepID=A0A0D1X8P4_9PEZI|nr:uncharacterized protein PV09_09773 [Verruconis gallopava]KIV98390.1 hypothetical protein PV09_09773 [Verruconis gallopava]
MAETNNLTMPSQKPSLRKRLNKKKKRRFGPLRGKCREYAELPGVELALFIAFEKMDRNNKIRKEFYSLRSKRNLPWLENIDGILLDNMNKNELLDEMGSDIEMPCGEQDDEIGGDTIVVGGRHQEGLNALGSPRTGPVFPPLPDLDLDLICDIMSF